MSSPSPDLEKLGLTGLWTAAIRARESAREDALFVDPLAALFANAGGSAELENIKDQQGQEYGALAIVIRTRFFDDFLLHATHDAQIRQVVMLAAGMDSHAYRLAWPAQTQLFELDQPHVLAAKEQILSSANAVPTCQRHTIGVDLSQPWTEPLQQAGFDPTQRAVWLLEGFLSYLPLEAMLKLFDVITAQSVLGSKLAFDVVNQDMFTSPWTHDWIEAMAQAGIPWRSSLDNPEAVLGDRGWDATVAQDGDPDASYGRWSFPPVPDRSVPGWPRNFLVMATRQ
jgi:methyltransferase (TIGR00027 family)